MFLLITWLRLEMRYPLTFYDQGSSYQALKHNGCLSCVDSTKAPDLSFEIGVKGQGHVGLKLVIWLAISHMVSWVCCGSLVYQFLIFVFLFT